MLNFIIARVLKETLVVEIDLINLHWAALIAHHELLEVQETSIEDHRYCEYSLTDTKNHLPCQT